MDVHRLISRTVQALVLFFPLCALAQDIGYLESNSHPDGSIASESGVSTTFQSTAETLQTMIYLKKTGSPAFESARAYLNSALVDETTENLALRIMVNHQVGSDVRSDVEQLLLRKAGDGGFGAYPGFDRTALDTAYALYALAVSQNISSNSVDSAILYLKDEQLDSGGWGLDSGLSGSIEVTSLILEALRFYSLRYDLSDTIRRASSFLYSKETESGGWGSSDTTASALLALIPSTSDSARYSAALESLKVAQRSNLSWDNDTFITARALRAIGLSKIGGSTILDVAAVTGRIVDAETQSPLAGVSIDLSGGSQPVVATTGIDGSFSLPVSEPGVYTVSYSAGNYVAKESSFSLVRLQNADVGTIALQKAPDLQFSTITGKITYALTGEAIAGAVVAAGSANVITAADGSYTLKLTHSDPFTITVSKDGYQSLSASAEVQLGSTVVFSPSLYSESDQPPADTVLAAKIVDGSTGSPVLGAEVSLSGSDSQAPQVILSDVDGRVAFEGVSSGSKNINIRADGYSEFIGSLIAPVGANIDLGEIRLKSVPSYSSVVGAVTRSDNGDVVSNALIEVVNTELTAISGSDGRFLVSGVADTQFTVRASAPGFMSFFAQVSVEQHQELNLDIVLKPVEGASNFKILSIAPALASLGAHQKGSFSVEVQSHSESPLDLQMVMEVRNENGYFSRFPAAHDPFGFDEISDSVVSLPANFGQGSIDFSWMTGVSPPGEYTVVIQAYDMGNLQLVAESSTSVVVEETKRITALSALALPRFLNVGQDVEVVLSAEVNNSSNALVVIPVSYSWADPEGNEIRQGLVTLSLQPKEMRKVVELDRFMHHFDMSGEYLLTLSSEGEVIPLSFIPAKISVAPSVRVDPLLEVNPNHVTPDGDKRIRLKIKVSGRSEG